MWEAVVFRKFIINHIFFVPENGGIQKVRYFFQTMPTSQIFLTKNITSRVYDVFPQILKGKRNCPSKNLCHSRVRLLSAGVRLQSEVDGLLRQLGHARGGEEEAGRQRRQPRHALLRRRCRPPRGNVPADILHPTASYHDLSSAAVDDDGDEPVYRNHHRSRPLLRRRHDEGL